MSSKPKSKQTPKPPAAFKHLVTMGTAASTPAPTPAPTPAIKKNKSNSTDSFTISGIIKHVLSNNIYHEEKAECWWNQPVNNIHRIDNPDLLLIDKTKTEIKRILIEHPDSYINNFTIFSKEHYHMFIEKTIQEILTQMYKDNTPPNNTKGIVYYNKHCFQFERTNMILNAAEQKYIDWTAANILTGDDIGFMTMYYFTKKNMEYAFKEIYNFFIMEDSEKNTFEFVANDEEIITFLMIDLENILGVCGDRIEGLKDQTPLYDRELVIIIIIEFIKVMYGENIIPVFSINNFGVHSNNSITIKKNDKNQITHIFFYCNIKKGELDDYFISTFCDIIPLIFSKKKFNFYILSKDNMKWWDRRTIHNFVYLYNDDKIKTLKLQTPTSTNRRENRLQNIEERRHIYGFFNDAMRALSGVGSGFPDDLTDWSRTESSGYLNRTAQKRTRFPHTVINKYQIEKDIDENKLLLKDSSGVNKYNSVDPKLTVDIKEIIFGEDFNIKADPPNQVPFDLISFITGTGKKKKTSTIVRSSNLTKGGKRKIITSKTKKNGKSKNYKYKNSKKNLNTQKK